MWYSIFQGLRPDLPSDAHPKLLELMQRCWDAVPCNRPSFFEIAAELENLLEVGVPSLPSINIPALSYHFFLWEKETPYI